MMRGLSRAAQQGDGCLASKYRPQEIGVDLLQHFLLHQVLHRIGSAPCPHYSPARPVVLKWLLDRGEGCLQTLLVRHIRGYCESVIAANFRHRLHRVPPGHD